MQENQRNSREMKKKEKKKKKPTTKDQDVEVSQINIEPSGKFKDLPHGKIV